MIITLTTDFGNDAYVGIMKGVILRINPDARIVDLHHHIDPQHIDQAAFILKTAVGYFPDKTIYCIVVDPGVGSERKILLAETDNGFFIAPDNGVLKYIFNEITVKSVHQINNPEFRLEHISSTFHGRDIFAPAAAHLSLGVQPGELGPITSEYDEGQIKHPVIQPDKITGEILFFDHFGNAITNVPENQFEKNMSVYIDNTRIPFHAAYSDAEENVPLCLTGSHNHLEIAVRNGNAREQLSLKKGQIITLVKKDVPI